MLQDTQGSRHLVGQAPPSGLHGGLAFVCPRWLLYPVSSGVVVLLAAALSSAGVTGGRVAAVVPFLLAVLLIALVWGPGPGAVAALVSTAAFHYFLVPPLNGFTWPSTEEALLLVALLVVALGLGTLTDRMRAARRQADQWAASERLQKALLNCLSHDLRTPLTSIMGSLSTLLEEGQRFDEHARRELLDIAYTGAQQLDRLVAQVLEMTRLEARATRVQREPASVAGVVRAACSQLRQVLDGRRCQINLPDTLPAVPMDTVLLSHAVMNVLDNAVKYSPADAAIDVSACLERNVMVLSVADRGAGVPADQLSRIFEKFHRLQPSSGDTTAGSGLGLAIAKEIVEAHGGRIWAEQRPGGGTIVRLGLPIR